MFHQKHFPYMRAYEDYDGSLFYTIYYENGIMTTIQELTPCTEVINFCELDMSDYKRMFNEFTQTVYSEEKFEDLCNMAWGMVDWLKDKSGPAYLFTSYGLSDIFRQPIALEMSEDENFMKEPRRKHIIDAKNHLEEVIIIHEIFSYGLELCLDKENMPSKHVSEKLMEFLSKCPQFTTFVLPTGYALYRIDNKTEKEPDKEERYYMTEQTGENLSVISYVVIERLVELFYFEFMRIMKDGRQIKRCKNCGKYFVLRDKRKRQYCGRIFKDGKKCNEIGHLISYKESLGEESDPLRVAKGFYNTMYSRMSRALDKLPGQESEKDISEEEFKNWSKKYSNAKRNYKNGIISGDEMLSIIREGYV